MNEISFSEKDGFYEDSITFTEREDGKLVICISEDKERCGMAKDITTTIVLGRRDIGRLSSFMKKVWLKK